MTTATEWLFNQLWDTPKDKLTWYALLKQANEMFEDQIISAASDHCYPTCESARTEAEQYYNETFKSK